MLCQMTMVTYEDRLGRVETWIEVTIQELEVSHKSPIRDGALRAGRGQ